MKLKITDKGRNSQVLLRQMRNIRNKYMAKRVDGGFVGPGITGVEWAGMNSTVMGVMRGIGLPDYKMEYFPEKRVFLIEVETNDIRWDRFAIYVRGKEVEVRVPTGFYKGDRVGAIDYVERV